MNLLNNLKYSWEIVFSNNEKALKRIEKEKYTGILGVISIVFYILGYVSTQSLLNALILPAFFLISFFTFIGFLHLSFKLFKSKGKCKTLINTFSHLIFVPATFLTAFLVLFFIILKGITSGALPYSFYEYTLLFFNILVGVFTGWFSILLTTVLSKIKKVSLGKTYLAELLAAFFTYALFAIIFYSTLSIMY